MAACAAPRQADYAGLEALGVTAPEPLSTQWHQVGSSFEGRPLRAATFGTGPLRVYLLGGIHGDERAGGESLPRLRERLRDAGFLGETTLRVLEDMNPDGTHSSSRFNARGVDLNRNFPASNFRSGRGYGAGPLSESESASMLEDLHCFDPHFVIVFHAARRGPFVNYDGPCESLASTFAGAASEVDSRWHVKSEMGYETPGSLGSLLGVDDALPVLTVEFGRTQSAEEAWPALEAGMAALFGADGSSALRSASASRP
jgi:protein MpaA